MLDTPHNDRWLLDASCVADAAAEAAGVPLLQLAGILHAQVKLRCGLAQESIVLAVHVANGEEFMLSVASGSTPCSPVPLPL